MVPCPRHPATMVTSSSFTIVWDKPYYDGGVDVDDYMITMVDPSGQNKTIDTKLTVKQYLVNGLSPATMYTGVAIRAHNGVGWGPWSVPISAETLPPCPPGSPRNFMLVCLKFPKRRAERARTFYAESHQTPIGGVHFEPV